MDASTYTDLPRFTSLIMTRKGREIIVRKASRSPLDSSPSRVIIVHGAHDMQAKVELSSLRLA
jgi:hypothetical protein